MWGPTHTKSTVLHKGLTVCPLHVELQTKYSYWSYVVIVNNALKKDPDGDTDHHRSEMMCLKIHPNPTLKFSGSQLTNKQNYGHKHITSLAEIMIFIIFYN